MQLRHSPWKSKRRLDSARVLAALGLQRRLDPITDIIVPSVTLFAVGALFGAGTAVLLSPKSGPTLRRELADGAKGLTRRLGNGRRRAMSAGESVETVER